MPRSSRRFLRPRRRITVEPQPDGLPKSGLFTEPIRITLLQALEPEILEDSSRRVTFRVEVKDADEQRCSDLAIDAHVTGPEREATVQVVTDLFGRARIRMTGPPGRYELEILEVAAKALQWAATDGPRTVRVEVE